jgi:hypothetical protein
MKAKKHHRRKSTPMSAIAAGFALAAAGAHAQTSPVFDYSFPASWNGVGATITDLSSAGNVASTVSSPSLDTNIPPSAAVGTQSLNTSAGAILTGASSSLVNSAIAAAGGFKYHVAFLWDGTDSTSFGHTEKLIDYAGTESLQLVTTSGSALLQMSFGDDIGNEVVPVSTTIAPNVWYDVDLTFDTTGSSVDGNGDISGNVSLVVNGGTPITAAATKGTYGDSLARPIGIGQLGAGFGYLVGFKGDIYNPSVTLGVASVPPAPQLLAPVVQNGSVNLSLIATNGFNYQIQASTNLTTTNWATLTNLAGTNGTLVFTDTNGSNFSKRYYRAVVTH